MRGICQEEKDKIIFPDKAERLSGKYDLCIYKKEVCYSGFAAITEESSIILKRGNRLRSVSSWASDLIE